MIAGRFRRKQVFVPERCDRRTIYKKTSFFSFFSIYKSLGFRDPPPLTEKNEKKLVFF